jgi:dihydroxyacetone kinase-like predicted kinase
MQSISVLQLQNMFLAFCSHIITQKHKINSINVFPVPDQDTGSNLAATFQKVKNELEKQQFESLEDLGRCIEKTALYSSQGNSGIIFTGFMAGFFGAIKPHTQLSCAVLSQGFKKGALKARRSIENPKDGTILNVMDDVASCMENCLNSQEPTLERLFSEGFIEGKNALARTEAQMAVLRESRVVDAGGLAFVMMLESFQESLTGKKVEIKEEHENVLLKKRVASITKNRIEVIFIVEESLMNQSEVQELLTSLGDSIDIIEIRSSVKVHIHTDQPETVKEIAYSLGTVVYLQVQDMKEEKVLELMDTT